MAKRKLVSLRSKIFGSYIIIIVVAFVCTLLLYPSFAQKNFYDDSEANLYNMMDKTMLSLKDNYNTSNGDIDRTVDYAYNQSLFDPYTEILFTSPNGVILHNNEIEKYNKFFNPTFYDYTDFAQETKEEGKVYRVTFDEKHFLISKIKVPFIGGGYICFAKNTDYFSTTLSSLLSILVILFGIFLLAGGTMGWYMSKMIADPIKELESYAIDIGNEVTREFTPNKSSPEIYSLGTNMKQMDKKLKQSFEKQQNFFGAASHELKTPLMKIQGYGEGLQKGLITDVQGTAGIIVKESKHINSIVEQLLTLYKIEADHHIYTRSEINLKDFLEDVQNSYYGICDIIQLEDKTKEPIITIESEELLYKAINNAISNSIRYAKSFVKISLEDGLNDTAVIRITDDGGGIPEEDLIHIYDRFYKGNKGSIGLGMSIMKSATIAMGGTVCVKNIKDGLQTKYIIPIKDI